jgi:3D (Asp-Asp-Asp) domain-containing protein
MKFLIFILASCVGLAFAMNTANPRPLKSFYNFDNYRAASKSNKVNSYYFYGRIRRRFNMTASFYSREEIHGAQTAGGLRGVTLYEAMTCQGLLQASVDVRRIPLYTRIQVLLWNGSVIQAMVVDTGPNYSENIIDIFVNTIAEAIELGRQSVQITLIK